MAEMAKHRMARPRPVNKPANLILNLLVQIPNSDTSSISACGRGAPAPTGPQSRADRLTGAMRGASKLALNRLAAEPVKIHVLSPNLISDTVETPAVPYGCRDQSERPLETRFRPVRL